MATETKMRQHAELIVDTCFTVEKGDVVTIITDDQHAHAGRRSWPTSPPNGAPRRSS